MIFLPHRVDLKVKHDSVSKAIYLTNMSVLSTQEIIATVIIIIKIDCHKLLLLVLYF